jgi:hypothetical protein
MKTRALAVGSVRTNPNAAFIFWRMDKLSAQFSGKL